jgi:multiple sugar transport system permease protein
MFAVFHEWTGVELINRWWVLLFVYPTLTVPFCTWVMIGYFASIPRELDEAALIDGANYRQVVTRIFIPVALPGIIAAAISHSQLAGPSSSIRLRLPPRQTSWFFRLASSRH